MKATKQIIKINKVELLLTNKVKGLVISKAFLSKVIIDNKNHNINNDKL